MVRPARGVPTSFGALERSLDRTIDRVCRRAPTAEARALLYEARRLRSIVVNWAAIPPSPEAHEDMLARVFRLASAAGEGAPQQPILAAAPEESAAPPSSDRPSTSLVLASPPPEAHQIQVVETGPRPVLARVSTVAAPLATPIDPLLVVAVDPYSAAADAYRALRHRLVASGDPRTIAVTSATAGEGKTVCAVNLALAFRETARGRVLLLEANLRAPRLAALLRLAPPASIVAQIDAHMTDRAAPWVAAEIAPRLDVMAIDTSIPHPPLLDALAFATGVAALVEAGYERIVIDAAPVLAGSDASVAAESADGVLFTARQMQSKRGELRKAITSLEPAPVLGAVVIG